MHTERLREDTVRKWLSVSQENALGETTPAYTLILDFQLSLWYLWQPEMTNISSLDSITDLEHRIKFPPTWKMYKAQGSRTPKLGTEGAKIK